MILLDTSVLSALMHDPPDPTVVTWLDRQNADEIWTTSVTVFEIRFGLSRLAEGRKRAALQAAFDGLLHEDLANRIASLDRAAAEAAGEFAARREAAGRPVDMRDTLIAGIALNGRARIASGNIRHYDDLETSVIDPWVD
ncbi:MAG: type II toxin-antitoxin system VapC family toxin [Acetobacteraceae bacterium]